VRLVLAIATLVVALALVGGGCDSDDERTGDDAPAAGAAIPGGGLTVEEALCTTAEGPLVVAGYLIEEDGELRLCSAILESDPPQCGEPSLEVRGEVGSAEIGERVSLLGDVEDGVLTVSETAQA
jgi:hypothetical protein